MAQLVSTLPVNSGRVTVCSNPNPQSVFEFINRFTIMKLQLIAVDYTGLQFTKGVFNPKPKALEEGGWTLKLINLKNEDIVNHRIFAQMTLKK